MIVDTGPLVAAANVKDPHSRACRELLVTEPGPLVVPALVVAEAAYLIAKYLGAKAEAALLRSLATERFRVEAPHRQTSIGRPSWSSSTPTSRSEGLTPR